MNGRAYAVRVSIALAVILGTIALIAVRSSGEAGAALTAKSGSGLASAKLPPGMCPGSNLPVTLSDGHGTSSANPDSTSYFYISISSGPVTLDVNHDGIKDSAAVFECNDGGTAVTTGLWIFDSKASGFKVLAGPMYPRSVGTGDWGAQIKSVAVSGSDLVVSEIYSQPGDPHCCLSGATTTTWAWHHKAMRIVSPSSLPGTLSVAAAPGTFGNAGNIKLPKGTHVAAVCTGASTATATQSNWTELNTGLWLPSSDVTPSSPLPDCDSNPGSKGAQPSGEGQPGTSATTTCPTAAQAMTAWRANPGSNQVAPGEVVSNIANISCWKNWVLGFAVGNSGNGSFVFSQTGGLHSLTAAEAVQFNNEVCSDAMSPSGWRGELGC